MRALGLGLFLDLEALYCVAAVAWLSVLKLLFDFVLPQDNPARNVPVDRIDQLAFLEHFPGDGFARK